MTPVNEVPRPAAQPHNQPPLSPKSPPTFSKMSTFRDRRRSAPGKLPHSPVSDRAGRSDRDPNSPARSQQNLGDSADQIDSDVEPSQRLLTPPLTEDEDLLYRFRDRAGSLSGYQPHERTSLDRQVESFFSPATSKASVSDVIRSIPKPRFPIRVFREEPKPFSLQAQQKIMRWTHERRHFWPDPAWLEAPSIRNIKETAWPYLKDLGADHRSINISFLTEGGFNRVFTIHTINANTQKQFDYVFRIALPVDPHYKTESEVATTEIVRHFTDIPVPIIYAYDSSTDNALGMEWILMEKIRGKKLDEAWTDMDYDSKLRLADITADWTAQLAKISSNKIGSIYMRSTAKHLEFYLGRCVAPLLSQENRLKYNVFRGPFHSLQDFYHSVLEITTQDLEELTQAFKLGDFRFIPTSPELRGTFLDRDVFYYLDGHEDWTDAEWHEEQIKELETLDLAIRTMRQALPVISAKAPETSRPLTTFLVHDDLSRRNVLVDDHGLPVALLDWENIKLEPLLFLTDPPAIMQSYVEDSRPENKEVDRDVEWERRGISEEEKKEDRWVNAMVYEENMENYVCTQMRKAYFKGLDRRECPLGKAIEEDFFFLDRQLRQRVLNISARVDDHIDWVEAMLAMGEDSDNEEDEDDEDEEDSPSNRDSDVGMEDSSEIDIDEGHLETLRSKGFSEESISLWRKGIWKPIIK